MKIPTQFSLRELLLATTVVALAVALWQTSLRVPQRGAPGVLQSHGNYKTVVGPLLVSYRIRTSPNSTSGSDSRSYQSVAFCR